MVPLDTGWNWTPYFTSKTTLHGVGVLAALHPVQDHVAHRDLAQQGLPRLSAEMILDSQYRSSAG